MGAKLTEKTPVIGPYPLLDHPTDLALTSESFDTRAEADPYVSKSPAAGLVRSYLGETDPKNPLASPLYGDLSGLPPIRVHVGDDEVLLDDSRRYSRKWILRHTFGTILNAIGENPKVT